MKQCMGCMEIYQDNLTKCPICGYEEGTMPENTLHMEPGSILNNRYVIGKVLGYGGFGVTYIAWDTLLEQKVAIKEFLPSEYATRMLGRLEVTIFSGDKRKQFMEGLVKFIAEAKKIAKFNNVPGIVKIFDCIEENSTAYIIMEYLEGMTLAEMLEKEKKMKPDKAIKLLLPVMEALKKVNLNGIIHRDIAPDNIFITSKGEPKLIDFGAARYATTSVSRSLTIIIKPGYSPEEQYRSMADQGSWTDVYSIGATLYRMITGETPPDAMERRAYIEQHGSDMLKPISKFINIDKNQENAIMNALNVKIQERTMNMGVLMEELTTDEDVSRLHSNNRRASNIFLDMPFKVKMGIVAGVIVLMIAVSLLGFFKGKEKLVAEGMTRVPNIRNISIELAIKKLESCNLSYKITGYTYSTSIPANSVMTQSIKVGKTVKIGTEVELTVSKVDNAYEMNNVLAMNITTAKKLLEDNGYVVNVSESRFDDVIAKDCVVKQNLDKKQGEKSITIITSKGKETPFDEGQVRVPDFVDVKLTECVRIAKTAGIMLEVVERKASKEVAEGAVISQLMEDGTLIDKGTVIKLIVSKGTDEITIDDFTSWDIEKAREFLTDQGIVLEEVYEVSNTHKHGIVFGQTPASGTRIKTGEKVTLKVSIGPEEFNMVSLYKKTEDEAIKILESYGLEHEIIRGYNKDVGDKCVYHQSIARGTKTKVGEKVIIKVSDASAEIELPKMVGEKIEDIEKELKNSGFIVRLKKEYSETMETGLIVSTNPEEGTKQKVGTTIEIAYSAGAGDIQSVTDVKGFNYIQAESTLTELGLKVKFKYEFSNEIEGTVIAQDIQPGGRASTGETCTLSVSKGPKVNITFASDPLKVEEGASTQTYVTMEPKIQNVSWSVQNTDIADAYASTNPSYEYDAYITHYVVVSAIKKGTTNLVLTITYIDGSTTTHKCKIIVE